MMQVNKKKIFLVISLFLLVLTSARIFWLLYHQPIAQPEAENGILDLSDWIPLDHEPLTLNGEWDFYPELLLKPEEIKETGEAITVPRNWEESLPGDEENLGFGTYRLTVLLPETDESRYGLKFRQIFSAAQVYINGEEFNEFGQVGTTAESSEGRYGPFSHYFSADTQKLEIVIQVANFNMPAFGGITKPILIGTEQTIIAESKNSQTLQIVVSALYFFHALYAFLLSLNKNINDRRVLFFFGLMLLLHGTGILLDDDAPLQLPINPSTSLVLLVFFIVSALMMMITFLKELFQVKSRFYYVLLITFIGLMIFNIIFSFDLFALSLPAIFLFFLISIVYLYKMTIKAVSRYREDAIYILMFLTAYSSNMLWGGLINVNIIDIPYYPVDFLATVISIVLLMLNRYGRITEENKRQASALKIADKKKDEFLANTSHELRNPLHGIINIAYTFLEDPNKKLTEEEREQLKMLLNIGNRMTRTLDDLLDISQLQDQRVKLNQTSVNINSVTSGTINMVRYLVGEKNIVIKNEISANFPLVHADKNRLIQVLFNLLHNAVKYTESGKIKVTATSHRKMATISVHDTGIGIRPEDAKNIFEMYEQIDTDRTNLEGGIGLGLWISKEIVELHGGEISLDSVYGKGSVIHFTIPIAERQVETQSKEESILYKSYTSNPEVAATTEPATQSEQMKSIKILVVDDDPLNLQALKSMLSAQYQVRTAYNGEKALELLSLYKFDLVLTDVMMPHMSGYELTEKIREKYSIAELPILLLTARTQTEDIYTGFMSGANDYIVKPVNPLELKARIEAFADLQRSIEEQLKMEAAWLQAQIQPHFLFNTLNSIASLAMIDTNRMVRLLEAFGKYLRNSFDQMNTKTLVPIAHELELMRSYVAIEEERFSERLKVMWDLDQSLDFEVPPLSIQPLVENAINHGVLKRVEGGTVTINIKQEQGSQLYIIEVSDNGVGMSADKVTDVLSYDINKRKGIGIGNTNHRLVKLYGEGLEIDSVVGKGTTIRFRVWDLDAGLSKSSL